MGKGSEMTVTDLHSKASRMRSREPVGFRLLIRPRNHAPASACGDCGKFPIYFSSRAGYQGPVYL